MTSRSRPEAVRSRAAAVDEVEGHVVGGAVEELRVELERRALVLDLEVLHQLNTQTQQWFILQQRHMHTFLASYQIVIIREITRCGKCLSAAGDDGSSGGTCDLGY